jgi:hypothetical protein
LSNGGDGCFLAYDALRRENQKTLGKPNNAAIPLEY